MSLINDPRVGLQQAEGIKRSPWLILATWLPKLTLKMQILEKGHPIFNTKPIEQLSKLVQCIFLGFLHEIFLCLLVHSAGKKSQCWEYLKTNFTGSSCWESVSLLPSPEKVHKTLFAFPELLRKKKARQIMVLCRGARLPWPPTSLWYLEIYWQIISCLSQLLDL